MKRTQRPGKFGNKLGLSLLNYFKLMNVFSIPDSHILPFGGDHNFWRLGPNGGPCGSCTEIHVDRRPAERRGEEAAYLVNSEDDPSIVELWNLVFMQYNRFYFY